MKEKFLVIFISLMMTSSLHANDLSIDEFADGPSIVTVIADAFIVRPFSLLATVAGGAAYIATLPFSVAGGNTEEVADLLIREPAYHTFSRCLGCIKSQALEERKQHKKMHH
jgi:hypothetical protein